MFCCSSEIIIKHRSIILHSELRFQDLEVWSLETNRFYHDPRTFYRRQRNIGVSDLFDTSKFDRCHPCPPQFANSPDRRAFLFIFALGPKYVWTGPGFIPLVIPQVSFLGSLDIRSHLIGSLIEETKPQFCLVRHREKMPHKTRPMAALLLFTGLNVVLVSTISPVYDFVCFLPYWERRREHRRQEREATLAKGSTSG